MAKQRYINTKFWSDCFISDLNPLDRYLFLYFLTNEHTNICGIYEVPLKTISFETGLEIDMLKKMLKRLTGKIFFIDGWVYVKNFAKHQAVNESIKKGIEVSKKEIPEEIMNKINKIDQLGDSLYTASPHDQTYPNSNLNSNTNPNEAVASTAKGNKKTFNPLGGEIIKALTEIDPKNKTYYSNKTQRSACDFLLEEYGLEAVLSRIKLLPQLNKMPYFPSIHTAYDLKEKWMKLEEAVGREQFKLKANVRQVVI